jgi:murein hydrolase activator
MKKLLYIFLSLFTTIIFAQDDKEKLEARKEQLYKEINDARIKFKASEKKEKSVLKEIAFQESQIKLNENVISTIAKQSRILDDNIYLTQLEINRLNKELKIMKEDYAKMIVKSYKSRSEQSRIMFVLSSSSFLQAYKRIQYMKQYAGYRKRQAEEIKLKQQKLGYAVNKLAVNKKEKEIVIAEKTKVVQDQEKIKKVKEKTALLLKKDKKKIAAEIANKEKERKNIEKKIKKMIADAIKKENEKTAAKNAAKTKAGSATTTKPAVSSTKIELTPEAKLTSDGFKANKGKLPWPVEKGAIYIPFGNSKHPEYKDVDVSNSGMDIATEAGSFARAVYSGEVSSVIISPNSNTYSVLIRHGDYFTSYSNLSSVSVAAGQKVTAKQSLGKIKTNLSGKAVVKFTVSQNNTFVNPKTWITTK